jgi:2,3-bisphosphoglycerate-dependent phosphoglycerate mutase
MPQLVLIRHGQSTWNLENRFTGWWDVDVTERGRGGARRRAADEPEGAGFRPVLHQLQTRAIKTLNLALEEMGRLWLPVEKDWRLNERHYGGLTGLDKAETAAKHGDDQVKIWRRSFDIPPPPLEAGSEFDLSADRRYAGIAVPATESLKDTIARVLPYWDAASPRRSRRAARADLRARQFAARTGQASVEHSRRRDHRAGDSDRPADRL